VATFPASLVTPERILLEEPEVEAVVLRTDDGDATFLAGHTPLVGALVPGLVRFVRSGGDEERVAVHGGFVKVDGDRVTVLAPVAELSTDIDVERARRALQAAEERLAELGAGRSEGEDGHLERALAEARAAAERARVRLEVAGA